MDSSNWKIFIVDDDTFHLNLMEQMLRSNNYEDVKSFSNSIECLDNLHQNPDIIFLDHNMDVYTGYEVLKKIKRNNPNIFVVMVSSQEEIKTAVDSLKHGAFDYIQKNENLEENILETLNKISEVKTLLKQRKQSIFKTILKYI